MFAAAVRPALLAVLAVVVVAVVVVAVPLGVAPAAAHTAFASSDPAGGSTVDTLETVTVSFTEAVTTDLATLTVTGPSGQRIDDGEATVEDVTLQVGVSPIEAGEHQLAYRVVAADGHPVSGTVTFTYAGEPTERTERAEPAERTERAEPPEPAEPEEENAPAPATPAAESAGASDPLTGMNPWLAALVALGGLAVAATVLLRAWRAHSGGAGRDADDD
jgi:methionine-rich copper-binding protein CopC